MCLNSRFQVRNGSTMIVKVENLSSSYFSSVILYSIQFSLLVVFTLCNPMDCSTPGLSVHHQLPELAQTHVHGVGDAIQPSHHLSSPSPLAFNLSQHQVFSSESALHIRWPKIGASASASVLTMNSQD